MSNQAETFGTAINCMDGRVQVPVNEAVRSMFDVDYVDMVTGAGIVKRLSDEPDSTETESVLDRVRISVEKHGSRAIAMAAHDDCAGNPISPEQQKTQVEKAVGLLRKEFPTCSVVGFWLGTDWKVEVCVPSDVQQQTAEN